MLKSISPKLPMRDKAITRTYYNDKLGFRNLGNTDYDGYLMMIKDEIEIHFFEFKELNPSENYGQVYIRVDGIDQYYESLLQIGAEIHPNGKLETKPWGQKEFSVLDPDNNLLTFGESIS